MKCRALFWVRDIDRIPSMRAARLFFLFTSVAVYCGIVLAQAPPGMAGSRSSAQLPDGAGKEITQKVCGATCHGADIIMGTGRSRSEWSGVVNSMIARGAKATDTETVQIAQYLSSHFGSDYSPPAPVTSARMAVAPGPGASTGRGPGPLGSGAADSHVVDKAGADRGKTLYIAECITCHGNKARGGNPSLPANQQGVDLVRSVLVLHDRYGSEVGKYLARGHPLQSGRPSSALTKSEVGDLAHFLHQRIFYTLRGGGPDLEIQNVLTGDAKAGLTYFNGAGQCSTCHSAKGDLAGIGKKYDPPTLQSKFLFPRTVGFGRPGAAVTKSKPVTVTVTGPNGEVTDGVLDTLDDFNVSLRDAQGDYHSFAITPALKVVKHDPYAAHVELLDKYTDKNMHDIVAYLESLK